MSAARTIGIALALGLLARSVGAQEGRTAEAPKAPTVEAQLTMGKNPPQKVILVGRRDDRVVYQFAESSQVTSAVAPREVTHARLSLEVDQAAVAKAVRTRDWFAAGSALARGVAPALPFLDLRGNNALPQVMRAGVYFLLAAEQKTGCRFDSAARAAAAREYRYAGALFQAAMQAEWSDRADAARMLAAVSLVGQQQTDKAAELLAGLAEPDATDDTRGLYGLAQAEVLHAQGKTAEALEAAIASLVFADKDITTFPTALLLSAHCYGLLGEWHRTRDVCYEVARLFPGTHWEAAARTALRGLMEEGRTAAPEAVDAQAAFFGVAEDLNAKVMALLEPTPVGERQAGAAVPGDTPEARLDPNPPNRPDADPPPQMQDSPIQETPKP